MTTDLRTLGRAMRDAQRAYFRDRSRENLIASKQAEAAFDAALNAEPSPAPDVGFNVPYPHVPRYPTGVENPALVAEPAPAPDVAELVAKARRELQINGHSRHPMSFIEPLCDLLETLARQRDEALVSERNLGNLLARIHRDGGCYQAKHGTLQACVDADLVVSELLAKADALAAAEARVKGFESALTAFETATEALPLGHKDRTKGASSYNWRKFCLEEIRTLIKDTADE